MKEPRCQGGGCLGVSGQHLELSGGSSTPVLRSTWRSLVKCGQLRITCFAVSHCHPQLQAGDSKPGTRHLCRNAARPIWSVRIYVRRLLCAFGKPACRRSKSFLRSILSGFQPPPESGSRSAIGGPPSSSLHRSQHHCFASRYTCQRVRGARRGSVAVAGADRGSSAHGGSPRCPELSAICCFCQRTRCAEARWTFLGVVHAGRRRPCQGTRCCRILSQASVISYRAPDASRRAWTWS